VYTTVLDNTAQNSTNMFSLIIQTITKA